MYNHVSLCSRILNVTVQTDEIKVTTKYISQLWKRVYKMHAPLVFFVVAFGLGPFLYIAKRAII